MRLLLFMFLILAVSSACAVKPFYAKSLDPELDVATLCGYLRNIPPMKKARTPSITERQRVSRNDQARIRISEITTGSDHGTGLLDYMDAPTRYAIEEAANMACSPYFNAATEAKFSVNSDETLCMQHMSFRRNDSAQIDIRWEIKRRGVDCWEYGDVEAAHRKLDEEATARAEKLASEKAAAKAARYEKLVKAARQPKVRQNSPKIKPTKLPSPPMNVFLRKSESIIGGVRCHYSDGSVTVIRDTGYCPR